MFEYSDPIGDGMLEKHGAMQAYRKRLHEQYASSSHTRNSAFTKLEAFDGASDVSKHDVTWTALPKLSAALDPIELDRQRLTRHDEYVEWQVIREGNEIREVIFTTEFRESYLSLAEQSMEAVVDGIRQIYPQSRPTAVDLFGAGIEPDKLSGDERAARFDQNAAKNPWNNGERGLLYLTQGNNNLFALFELVDDCTIPNLTVPASEICARSSCNVGRNSDPAVCQALQLLARGGRGISLADPPGVTIRQLGGIWELRGRQIDIEDIQQNEGRWNLSRNGHRASLRVDRDLRLAGSSLTNGAQVARLLQVGVTVMSAPDQNLPIWARRGQESTRRIV